MKIRNGKYRHYKGDKYEVLGVAKNTETNEDLVVYRALYGEFSLFVRPLNMFIEKLIINGKVVARFKYIDE